MTASKNRFPGNGGFFRSERFTHVYGASRHDISGTDNRAASNIVCYDILRRDVFGIDIPPADNAFVAGEFLRPNVAPDIKIPFDLNFRDLHIANHREVVTGVKRRSRQFVPDYRIGFIECQLLLAPYSFSDVDTADNRL